jgi:hypothetical protein
MVMTGSVVVAGDQLAAGAQAATNTTARAAKITFANTISAILPTNIYFPLLNISRNLFVNSHNSLAD